jgi:hypothetical protein
MEAHYFVALPGSVAGVSDAALIFVLEELDAPRLRDAISEILNRRFRLHFWKYSHHDLIRGVPLERLETQDEELVRRFSETRRSHPLAPGGNLLEAIQRERPAVVALQKQDWGLAEDVKNSIDFFMTTPPLRLWLQSGYAPDYEDAVAKDPRIDALRDPTYGLCARGTIASRDQYVAVGPDSAGALA